MEQLIIGLLGALGAIFAFQAFSKHNADKKQKELEKKVAKLKREQSRIELDQTIEDRKTKEQVDEITKEQNDKPSGQSLSDWFNRRK